MYFMYVGKYILVILITLLMFVTQTVRANDYDIGVFYFPGWKDRQLYAPSPLPWEPIKKFPEKEPLLGWYAEGSDDVMQKQIDWMSAYGIDYVIFDWYQGNDKKVYLKHAIDSYMRAPNRGKLEFTILWANHDVIPTKVDEWDFMVGYWVKYYFSRPEFKRIDGKPVVFIFSADMLKKQAEAFGYTTQSLFDRAQNIARAAGFSGIHFVAGTGTNRPMIDSYARNSGYQSFSAYNFHQGPNSPIQSHSYAELDRGYREHWNRFLLFGNLPLIVPMTSGWDKRPWGGSKDMLHDKSMSSPEGFELHLKAAKEFMDAMKKGTPKMGVICCWNEFGEGSYIEPTKVQGFSYLEKVKKVFGGEP